MSVIAKDFSPLVQALRQKVGRTSFSFRFEDLFTKEEWLNMSVKERTRQEREFIARMDHIPNIRMPFSSEEGYKFKLYNQEYQYNEVKNNFKSLS